MLVISFNIKMDHLHSECQRSLLRKVTLVVPVLPFPFKKVTLEAAGRQRGQSGELTARTPCPGAATGSGWGLWNLSKTRLGSQAQNVAQWGRR